MEEKGVDWDPFEEEKSDEKLREDYNIEAEVVLDDAIKPLREVIQNIGYFAWESYLSARGNFKSSKYSVD